jgi:hypothetical protein
MASGLPRPDRDHGNIADAQRRTTVRRAGAARKVRRDLKRLTSLTEGLAVGVVLAISLLVVPATAQTLRPDPGPEEPRTPQMIRMMRDMRADMDRMRDEMSREGTGAMRERMGSVLTQMQRITEMLERHQRDLQQSCPGLAPKDPKAGG